jgi:hypothetical protein
MGLGVKEIDIPDPQHSHNQRNIFCQWLGTEMLIHFMSTIQQS